MAALCPALTAMDISFCAAVTDEGMMAVAGQSDRFILINKTYTMPPDIQSVSALILFRSLLHLSADICVKMRNLDLTQCVNLTDSSILKIADHCPDLRQLNIRQVKREKS